MFENGFFDYIDDIIDGNNLDRKIVVGNILLNDSIRVIKGEKRIMKSLQSIKFINYFVYINNKVFDKCRKDKKFNVENHRYMLNEMKKCIQTYDDRIMCFVKSRDYGEITNDQLFVTCKSILLFYGMCKYYNLFDDTDASNDYINMYSILRSGYIPCGWVGGLDVGGRLCVC